MPFIDTKKLRFTYPIMWDEDIEAFKQLTRSIQNNGQHVPVIIDKENNVIDGTLRVMACQQLDIPVKYGFAGVVDSIIKPVEEYLVL